MRSDVVFETTKNGEKQVEVIRPEDLMGIFGVKVDDGSFEPISKDQKRQDFLAFIGSLQTWQGSSVEQAERTQDPTDALRIDWNQIAVRGAEHFAENSSHFLLPAVAPPPAPEEAPAPDMGMGELTEPMPADIALGEAPVDPLSVQPDGKSMPDSFPIRNVNALAAMM
jgi:hypothetical protein